MDKQIENGSRSEELRERAEEVGLGTRDLAEYLFKPYQIWAARNVPLAYAAYHAILDYWGSGNQLDLKAALKAIGSCSAWESSESRLFTVLCLVEMAPPEIFWPAFMDEWSDCDATWGDRARVLRALKNQKKPALSFFSRSQRKFFETLPPLVRVFRGCSAPRVRGNSWTVDRALAEEFARGHRGRVPEPVVASALIPKEHIFFVTDEREEKEIVLNPRRLRKVFIEPFEGV